MALDAAILEHCPMTGNLITFRLYSWNNPTLSIGFNQSLLKEINLDTCKRLHICVVKRITGGKAVLHYGDYTYSLILPLSSSHPGERKFWYKVINQCLINVFQSIGLSVQLALAEDLRSSPFDCFQRSAENEILLDGRKFVGSAQRVKNKALLQHGSIQWQNNSTLLSTLFKAGKSGDEPATMPLPSKPLVPLKELESLMVREFEDLFGCEFKLGELMMEEQVLMRELLNGLYGKREWYYHWADSAIMA